jgi:iron complex transport system ATP-binding protein
VIAAADITFQVKGRTILHPVNFSTEREEFIVILGPNGAGKSTLVKLLSNGLKPASGTISYYGKNLSEWSHENLAKYRGYMHQESLITSGFTVREVLEMARYRYPETPSGFNRKIMEKVVAELDLQALLPKEFNVLSGGEKQRVQFGRVLLQLESEEPGQPLKYLFLDEPLNNLDVKYQVELLNYARSFVDSKRGTVIVVMHDINLCYQYADRVLLMQQGKVLLDGTPQQVMQPELLSTIYQIRLEQIQSLHGQVFFRHATHGLNSPHKTSMQRMTEQLL